MDTWNTYKSRISAHGDSKYNAAYKRETRLISSKLPDSLSYHTATIYSSEYGFNIESKSAIQHKSLQDVAIIDSDNLNEKTLYTMPQESISIGSLVAWMDNYWLVYECDANTTLYTRAKLLQCNHLLKWITKEDKIIEQWCVVEDGTKYLTGELEDKNFVVTRGDSRISVQLAKNKFTSILDRESRFLIDDSDSPHKLAYLLTKPFKKGAIYNGEGTFKFVLQEVTATEYDNHELGIADYYYHFPKNNTDKNLSNKDDELDLKKNEKRVWI